MKYIEKLQKSCGLCQLDSNFKDMYPTLDGRHILTSLYYIMRFLCYLNLSMHFKAFWATVGVSEEDIDTRQVNVGAREAIDIWHLTVLLIMVCFFTFEAYLPDEHGERGIISIMLVFYFLFVYIFNSVYIHIFHAGTYDCENKKISSFRRYIDNILSFGYSLIFFAYFYLYYSQSFSWNQVGLPMNFMEAFYQSLTTAFTLTLGGLSPIDSIGRLIIMGQLINSFIYLTLIISGNTFDPMKKK